MIFSKNRARILPELRPQAAGIFARADAATGFACICALAGLQSFHRSLAKG
ncbi:hypothetical protein NPS46_00320 [Pseudomonas putida]|uniref:hypothetical protein n=1 Tax=Pseudomonas putida TaxID=303 RepID=UPI0023646791|nr:hypothetical protein [Pseudomonas putida]MDD2050994.1 hypothetical protein [Pseudomonas putida]